MDLQFYGANCVVLSIKGQRIVIDDDLASHGAKSIIKADDIVLFTGQHSEVTGKIVIDGPGEYEVGDFSIVGVAAQAHLDEAGKQLATIYKITTGDTSVLVTGHIYPVLSETQMEAIGMVDIMIVPVGGNGYTVDPIGAQKLIKEVEPKLVIPTHYADKSLKFEVPQQELSNALKELAMEPKETVAKLRLKPGDLTDVTQLIVLEKS